MILLYNELEDCLFLFFIATVNVPSDPINNTNNRVERNSHLKYFLPKVNVTNFNVLIDGRNFYDQPINDLIKQYGKIRKLQQIKEMITQQDVC